MTRNRAGLLPVLLILVGLVALLVNVGAIPTDRLYRLADLWPLLLIVLGLELVVNRARLPAAIDVTASVLIVVVALAGASLYVALGPAIPAGTQSMTLSEPVGDLKDAILEVDAGASTLDVEGSNTGLVNDLFQAQITYSGPRPTERLDPSTGRVVIKQNGQFGFFGKQSFQMDIQLNVAVRWSFATHTGASHDKYLLTMDVGSVEIDTGASTEDLSLGIPQGHVPIRINGGALTVNLHRDVRAAASVKVSGGAVSLTYDGDRTSAVGSVFHSTPEAPDMFEVTVNGGRCDVTMDTGEG